MFALLLSGLQEWILEATIGEHFTRSTEGYNPQLSFYLVKELVAVIIFKERFGPVATLKITSTRKNFDLDS